jgi:SnoaL-like domain
VRTDQVVDWIEINAVLNNYAIALDSQDWPLFETCFTPQAELRYDRTGGGVQSPSEWLAGAKAVFPVMFLATQHNVSTVAIEIDEDRASARSYVIAQHVLAEPAGELVLIGGHYTDTLIRAEGRWRIASRVAGEFWLSGDATLLARTRDIRDQLRRAVQE